MNGRSEHMTTIQLHIKVPGGDRHTVEAPEGFRVMEVIRDYGLPIRAECGGACACASCHVRIGDDWVDRVLPAEDEELGKLDEIPDASDYSRLSCQILTDSTIDGLEVEIAEDSLPTTMNRPTV